MEGLCKNCGQMHLVSAETQEEVEESKLHTAG